MTRPRATPRLRWRLDYAVLLIAVGTSSCTLLLDRKSSPGDGGDADTDADTDGDVEHDDGGDGDVVDVPDGDTDSGATCGDGVCAEGEDHCSCAEDCPSCGDGEWSCVSDECSCEGRVCDGVCYRGAECCTGSDCPVTEGETCDGEHRCQCTIAGTASCYPVAQDTYIEAGEDEEDRSAWNLMVTSHYSGSSYRLALIEFDLTGLPQCAGTALTSALMDLTFDDWGGRSGEVEAHVIEEAWRDELVTWPTRPDFDGTAANSVTIPGWSPGVAFTWDLTSTVREWLRSPSNNHGVILVAASNETSFWFYTAEERNSSYRPCLRLEFE